MDMTDMAVILLFIIALTLLALVLIPANFGGIDVGCNMTSNTLASKFIFGRCG